MATPHLTPLTTPSFLAWSAPFTQDGDFTPQDPLAVDYLNQQVGNWLFPGFTTRSSRAQYYAVVLYGLRLAEEAIAEYGEPNDDATRVALFERWERLWALSVLESHGGQLGRGHPDAMRGIRGAKRAWRPGKGPLPLDYPLISRQQELGGLGAYLTSLRTYKLVVHGDYRLTPLADPIVDAFWSEDRGTGRVSPLHQLALAALDRNRDTIPRKQGRASLSGLGRRARLSALVERERTQQQHRLYTRLFDEAPDDTTLAISRLVEDAYANDITDTEQLLLHALDSTRDDRLTELLQFALAYGHAARDTLATFNRIYETVLSRGWVAKIDDVVAEALATEHLQTWKTSAATFLDAPLQAQFRNLPVHARGFADLLHEVRTTPDNPTALLQALLRYHDRVQIDRRTGPGWLRHESGHLVADVTRYTGHRGEASFPNLKMGVVRQLLRDCGRIA